MSTLNPVHVRNVVQQIAQKFDDCNIELEHKVMNLLPKLAPYSDAGNKTLQKERITHINKILQDLDISLEFMEEKEGLTAEDKFFTYVFAKTWLKFSNDEKSAIIRQIQQAGIEIDSIPMGRIIAYQMSHLYQSLGLLGVRKLLFFLSSFLGRSLSSNLQSFIYPRVLSLSKRLVENYASTDIKIRGELAYQTAKKVADHITSTQVWKRMNYQFLGVSLISILGYVALGLLGRISPIFPAIYYTAVCDVLSFVDLVLYQGIDLANGLLYRSLIKNISERKEAITAIKAYKAFMECVKHTPPGA